MASGLLYVGVKRLITALDRASGQVVWEHKLPGVFGSYLTLLVDDGVLYASRQGVVYALDAQTGDPLWQSAVQGGKNVPMMMATSSGASADMQQQLLHKQQFDVTVAQGAQGGVGA